MMMNLMRTLGCGLSTDFMFLDKACLVSTPNAFFMKMEFVFDDLLTAAVLLCGFIRIVYLEYKVRNLTRAIILKHTGIDIEKGEAPTPPPRKEYK